MNYAHPECKHRGAIPFELLKDMKTEKILGKTCVVEISKARTSEIKSVTYPETQASVGLTPPPAPHVLGDLVNLGSGALAGISLHHRPHRSDDLERGRADPARSRRGDIQGKTKPNDRAEPSGTGSLQKLDPRNS